ncbi:MAG: Smr/MutS family protein [Lachnospiraceae bacterium]|nr:Smr/MutS family protein [Lachnospiraceae bacterium]
MNAPIIELDLHNMTRAQAQNEIDRALADAGPSVYRIRLIHGFHGGTAIKNMIQEEYVYYGHNKVKRVVPGSNQGITELVLREY